ncbi:MAG: DNA polymerase III subunit delta [Nitrospiraceae bacterium]|nr:DNA polymerase III subunit delta [Nitrospiraceae bacterium]
MPAKSPAALKAYLTSRLTSPPPIILLQGEDMYNQNQLIAQILEVFLPDEKDRVFGYETFEAQDAEKEPARLLGALKTLSLGQTLKIVVLRHLELASSSVRKGGGKDSEKDTDSKGKISRLDKALTAYFTHPVVKTLFVVSSAAELKKNSKLYHALPDRAVTVACNGLTGKTAVAFVQEFLDENGKTADAGWIELLIEIVGPDAQRLNNELEKVLLACNGKARLGEEDLDIVSPFQLPKSVFSLIDAITGRNPSLALSLLQEMLDKGEPPLRLLSVINWHYRLVGEALRYATIKEYGKLNRIHRSSLVINKIKRQIKEMKLSELGPIFSRLKEADRLLKGSRLPPDHVMAFLILNLASGKQGHRLVGPLS